MDRYLATVFLLLYCCGHSVLSDCLSSNLPSCVAHCPSVGELQLAKLRTRSEAVKRAIDKTIEERICEEGSGLIKYCCEDGMGEDVVYTFKGKCGITNHDSLLRVATGRDHVGLWPWMASFGYRRWIGGGGGGKKDHEGVGEQWVHECGGTLESTSFLSSRHVLTAAHCAQNGTGHYVLLGTASLPSGNVNADAVIIRVTHYEAHPDYSWPKAYFDVAVLYLEQKVSFTPTISPICLPTGPTPDSDTLARFLVTLTGWGSATRGQSWTDRELQRVDMAVHTQRHCNAAYALGKSHLLGIRRNAADDALPEGFVSSVMCAGNGVFGGSCKGDSGGPIVIEELNEAFAGRYVQVGIVHGSLGFCGDRNFPDIFARLNDEMVLNFVRRAIGLDPIKAPKNQVIPELTLRGVETPEAEAWVMVVGGVDGRRRPTDAVELVSLDPVRRPVPKCLRRLANYPTKVFGAVGGAVKHGSLPLVCGGSPESDRCYGYNPQNDTWTPMGGMGHPRVFPAATVHPERGLIISGGQIAEKSWFDTIISTVDGVHFDRTSYTRLPTPLAMHCQVLLDPSTLMVFTGHRGADSPTDSAYSVDLDSGGIAVLPSMAEANAGSGCGIVNRRLTSSRHVFVAGLKAAGVELFDVEDKQWKKGPSLPHNVDWNPAGVQYGDTFALVGGHNGRRALDTVYMFDTKTAGWTLLPNRLLRQRADVAAFTVKKDAFRDCED